MSFDPCDDCGAASGWPGVVAIALVWLVPTVLLVLQWQGVRSRFPMLFLGARAISFAAAVALTMVWMSEMSGDAELPTGYRWSMVVELIAAFLAMGSFSAGRAKTATE